MVADLHNEEDYESSLEPIEYLRGIQAVSELQKSFSELEVCLLNEIMDGHIPAKEFQSYISTLPLSLKNSAALNRDISEFQDTKGYLNDLFHFLNANLWNFFDHKVLTSAISKFGSINNQESVEKYIFNFELFLQNTTLQEFFVCWPGRVQKLHGYIEVTANIGGKPENYTLAKINQFKQNICSKFLPPLSEHSVLLYRHHKENFLFTWIMPSELAQILQESTDNQDFRYYLEQYQVHLSFKLGIYNIHSITRRHVFSPKHLTIS